MTESMRKPGCGAAICLLLLIMLLAGAASADTNTRKKVYLGEWGRSVKVDPPLNPACWMDAVSGERYLNEINIPGTHDAGTFNPMNEDGIMQDTGVNYAKTQYYSIPTQLELGVRFLDLRLCNFYMKGGSFGKIKNIDDGESLWLVHGQIQKKLGFNISGVYYCLDKYDRRVSLYITLREIRNFLQEYPSETIIIWLTNEEGNRSIIYKRAYQHLMQLASEINPATGKSYVYKAGEMYTEMPKLKDVRGQIVVFSSAPRELGMGGGLAGDGGSIPGASSAEYGGDKPQYLSILGKTTWYENHYEGSPDYKYTHLKAYYEKYVNNGIYARTLPVDASDYVSEDFPMQLVYTSCNKVLGTYPSEVATRVNPYVFHEYYRFDKERKAFTEDQVVSVRGNFYGWIFCDFITENIAQKIWSTNFFYGLKTCTVTVNPNNGQPTTSFRVLRQTMLTLPANYLTAPDGKNFLGWEVEDRRLAAGKQIGITEDVTVTALWGEGTSWAQLQKMINENDGGTITLESDVRPALSDETALIVPAGQSITINLNGHTITRGLAEGVDFTRSPVYNGVFNVYGELTILGDGVITGGHSSPDGIGAGVVVHAGGAFYMQGGTITGNQNFGSMGGGGVLVLEGGRFSMYGGEITENSSHSGGGVAVACAGSFSMEGGVISENTAVSIDAAYGDGGGVYVYTGGKAEIYNGDIMLNLADGLGGGIMLEGSEGTGKDNLRLVKGSIAGNTARGQGGAIAVCGFAKLTISGSIAIRGNSVEHIGDTETTTDDSNVFLMHDNEIELLGYVKTDDPIGISTEKIPGEEGIVCTEGLSRFSNISCFASDNESYHLILQDGEAVLMPHVAGELKIVDELEPSCEDIGVTIWSSKCKICGREMTGYTEYKAALGHNWGDWIAVTAATCETAGTETRTCKNDSEHTETRSIPALGHVWSDWSVTTAATCTAAGTKTRTCSRDASHVETQVIPATGHDWGDWIVTTAATCTSTGVETRTCANDSSHTETRSIPALGHKWDDGVVTTKPGCVTEGVRTYTCTRDGCGATKTESIPAAGHVWGDWHTTQQDLQKQERSCSKCQSVQTRKTPAAGHTHGLTHVPAKAATCEEPGNRTEYWICDQGTTPCGLLFSDEGGTTKLDSEAEKNLYIPALGHIWDDGVVTYQDCESEGVCTYTCTREGCGNTTTETVPARGHLWDAGTVTTEPGCETEGVRTYACVWEGCNETITESIPALGHEWDAGTVTKAADCVNPGVITYTCRHDSSHTRTESIAPTGHAWDAGTVTKEPGCATYGVRTYTCTKCGETWTESIAPLGHAQGEIVQTVVHQPTARRKGYAVKRLYCSRCGEMLATLATVPIDPLGMTNPTYTLPAAREGLTYNEWPQYLITPGTAEGGIMKYAFGDENGPTEEYARRIPTATEVGTYIIWYKVFGDGDHYDTDASKLGSEIRTAGVYAVVEIRNGEHEIGSGIDAVLTVKNDLYDSETFDRFSRLNMDGQIISPDSYGKARGSLIVRLKSGWLDTLTEGEHKMTVRFSNGQVSAPIQIIAAATPTPTVTPAVTPTATPTAAPTATPVPTKVPKTGDGANPAGWILMALIGIAVGTAGVVLVRKRGR